MIKLLTTLFLSITFIIVTRAQSPFGTVGTVWTYEGWSEGSGWQPGWMGDCQGNPIQFECIGDIIIDGVTCGIIKSDHSTDSLIAYQEDGIVYFHHGSTFYKLYDFNAGLGDTIVSYRPIAAAGFSLKGFFGGVIEPYEQVDTLYTLITGFDTTIINGVALKRWETKWVGPEEPVQLYNTIIENIGSLNGITGDHNMFIGTGCYGGFVCYQSDGFQYGSNFFPLCEFSSSTNDRELKELSIFPNPVYQGMSIELESDEIRSVTIYNALGAQVLKTTSGYIDLRSLSAGIYYVNVDGYKSKTIVKN